MQKAGGKRGKVSELTGRPSGIHMEDITHLGESKFNPIFLLFIAFHIPLAFAMYKFSYISTLHSYIVVVIGIWLALFSKSKDQVIYIGAYIAGAEVLWRMTGAGIFWEYGKYATALIFIIAILRWALFRKSFLPLVYFMLLVPSTFLLFMVHDPEKAGSFMSFNLSGPLALMVCVWFLSNTKISIEKMRHVLWTFIAPVIGICMLTIYSTLTASKIRFTDESNFITSGGFGPNQVSTILGLAALLIFMLYIFMGNIRRFFRIILILLIIIFATQSVMTFSRGGIYLAAAGAAVSAFFLLKDSESRLKILGSIAAVALIANFVVLPYLETFTGGALSKRFMNIDPGMRGRIVQTDLELWKENPVLGVGPGLSKLNRLGLLYGVVPHTEFTRLLAEHGLFGCLAIVMLAIMAFINLKRCSGLRERTLAGALMTWTFLFMGVNAMRLVAPAFIFGISFAAVLFEETHDTSHEN